MSDNRDLIVQMTPAPPGWRAAWVGVADDGIPWVLELPLIAWAVIERRWSDDGYEVPESVIEGVVIDESKYLMRVDEVTDDRRRRPVDLVNEFQGFIAPDESGEHEAWKEDAVARWARHRAVTALMDENGYRTWGELHDKLGRDLYAMIDDRKKALA